MISNTYIENESLLNLMSVTHCRRIYAVSFSFVVVVYGERHFYNLVASPPLLVSVCPPDADDSELQNTPS